METVSCCVVSAADCKTIKKHLEAWDLLHPDYKITPARDQNADTFFVPMRAESFQAASLKSLKIVPVDCSVLKACRRVASGSAHIIQLKALLMGRNMLDECLLPKKFELYDDFLILPDAFRCQAASWLRHFQCDTKNDADNSALCEFIGCLSDAFRVKNIAIKAPIAQNDLRTPQLLFWMNAGRVLPQPPLTAFWTGVVQQKIRYTWNPLHTMFSAGNITEKIRVGRFNAKQECVLDLYAGIGYFVLPFLRFGGAQKVIAIDKNVHSIEALKRNASFNGISPDRLEIFTGDNRDFVDFYRGKCDRVNLGLIPTSKDGWPLAISALKSNGGMLHIHENAHADRVTQHAAYILESIEALCVAVKNQKCTATLLHTECVKSYAPKINHYVFDVEVRKAKG